MKLFISPHPDDETLYGAFTLMREKPLVLIVTDSFVQFNRGEPITADQRWAESVEAMKILGCSVVRVGIRDDIIDEWQVKDRLKRYSNFETVYAPAIQGGHFHHDLIAKIAQELFPDVRSYCTYTEGQFYSEGSSSVIPTPDEISLKEKALDRYVSQITLTATKPHFDAVRGGKPEWYI